METMAFKIQATLHSEAQTKRIQFSPTVTFLTVNRSVLDNFHFC